jgi:SAM-dependent methyltransferase
MCSKKLSTRISYCDQCKKDFRVSEGIFDFLEEDVIDSSINAKNFTAQWEATQDAEALFGFTVEDYVNTYEYAFFDDNPNFRSGEIFLDVGCGSAVALGTLAQKYPQLTVVGLDVSKTILNSRIDITNIPNLFLIRASLFKMPFSLQSIDYVFCSGVLHHLQVPRDGFDQLVNISSNKVYFWVYPRIGLDLYDTLRKLLPSAYLLSNTKRLYLSKYLAPIVWLSQRLGFRASFKDLKESIAVIKLRIHDNISPEFQFKYDSEEVKEWFQGKSHFTWRQINELGFRLTLEKKSQ